MKEFELNKGEGTIYLKSLPINHYEYVCGTFKGLDILKLAGDGFKSFKDFLKNVNTFEGLYSNIEKTFTLFVSFDLKKEEKSLEND